METINFTRGVPANESFPTAELIDASAAVFKTHGNQMLQYGPSRGFEPLRQWLAEWQRVDVERVITSNGSLQLIEFLCLHLVKPGDIVFTESPSYDRTIGLLRRHGARVVGIEMEPDGHHAMAVRARLHGREHLHRPSGALTQPCEVVRDRAEIDLAPDGPRLGVARLRAVVGRHRPAATRQSSGSAVRAGRSVSS